MVSNKVSVGSKIMMTSDRQCAHEGPSPAILGLIGAILLILLGIVLQLDMFGYGHFNADSYWFISVIAGAVWDTIAVRMGMPALNVLIRLWPLLIVTSGLMILLSVRPARLARANCDSPAKGRSDA
jgi:hypothetical protein